MEKRKGLAMNIILIVLTTWVTSFVAKEKERASLSGATEKSMMESGKTIKKKAVEFGKDPTTFHMWENGIMTSFKDSEFWSKLESAMKVNLKISWSTEMGLWDSKMEKSILEPSNKTFRMELETTIG